jgi:hypothetical protein
MLSVIGRFFNSIIQARQAMYNSELEAFLLANRPKSHSEVESLINTYNRKRAYGSY